SQALWSAGGQKPRGILMNPSGTCLYTIQSDGKSSSIAAFAMSDAGKPVATPIMVPLPSADVQGLAIDASGEFLVVTDSAQGQVLAFTCTVSQPWTNQATVALTPAGKPLLLPGARGVAFNNAGLVCYVTDQPASGPASVHGLLVGANGLSPIASGATR